MSNKRIVNFTTCVRNNSIYDDRVIKVKSVLTRGIGDCWGLGINKPVLDGIGTHGSYKTFFYVSPLFTVTLTFNSIDAAEKFSDDDLKLVIAEIAKSLPSNMLIGAVAVNKS